MLLKLEYATKSPEDLIKMQIQSQQVWGGAWDSAFPKGSQAMPMLLVQLLVHGAMLWVVRPLSSRSWTWLHIGIIWRFLTTADHTPNQWNPNANISHGWNSTADPRVWFRQCWFSKFTVYRRVLKNNGAWVPLRVSNLVEGEVWALRFSKAPRYFNEQ